MYINKKNYLSFHQITDKGVKAIGKGLSQLKQLIKLIIIAKYLNFNLIFLFNFNFNFDFI